MKRSFVESIVTEKALHVLNRGSYAVDFVLNNLADDSGKSVSSGAGSEIKNVCAKVSYKLADEITDVCALLGVSKRAFVEAALIDAVAKSREILDEEGVYEYLKEHGPGGLLLEHPSEFGAEAEQRREEMA
ncbi:MAG TPA: hypothetical protein EYP90_06060 [Chromatiaceae bacterium]|nr:hypothetical protein [Chromatiaceae bacterium]